MKKDEDCDHFGDNTEEMVNAEEGSYDLVLTCIKCGKKRMKYVSYGDWGNW